MPQVSASTRRAFAFIALLTACQTSPAGRPQLVLLPSEEVDAQGESAFSEIRNMETIETDPAIKRYVQCVADSLTAALEQKRVWEVVVFRSEKVNAFAVPGGKIGVYTGMLRLASTPDQLAAVIGHEIGHVVAEHGRERISQHLVAGQVSGTLSRFVGGNETLVGRAVMAGLGVGMHVGVLFPFARAQENEADRLGLELMAKAGFDPRQSIELWKNMENAGELKPYELLSTHPSHSSRIEEMYWNMKRAIRVFEQTKTPPGCAHEPIKKTMNSHSRLYGART